jgi:putative transposase
MATLTSLASAVGVSAACAGLGLARSGYYRVCAPPGTPTPLGPRPRPTRGLTEAERAAARSLFNSERFADAAPRSVYATLLDEGVYLCHWRTLYRLLAEHDQLRERRDQLRHPAYAKPELLATGPRQLWSWDITKLRGPVKGQYFYLDVILDVFSRYVVGWMVAERESQALARQLIAETCLKEGILHGQLVLHADRGAAMVAKSVAQLLADLGVEPSHSRPHIADDNPFSEAQFKTMKYRPAFPDRFSDPAHAVRFGRAFFRWYNEVHRHGGLALLTPAMVHSGQVEAVLAQRQAVLTQAYAAHPERFVKGPPVVATLPEAVWINKPPTAPPVLTPQPALHSRSRQISPARSRGQGRARCRCVPGASVPLTPASTGLTSLPRRLRPLESPWHYSNWPPGPVSDWLTHSGISDLVSRMSERSASISPSRPSGSRLAPELAAAHPRPGDRRRLSTRRDVRAVAGPLGGGADGGLPAGRPEAVRREGPLRSGDGRGDAGVAALGLQRA